MEDSSIPKVDQSKSVESVEHTQIAETPEAILLEMVPEEKREEAKSVLEIITVRHSESFSGPIPPPAFLKGYEEICPGLANRIVTMAEKQSDHRIELESKAIGGQVDQSKRGQVFGFIIIFVCIIVAFLFAWLFDMKEFAGTFLTGTMVVLVGIFVIGKVVTKSDLKKKSKDQVR